jgi:hypothetical protein
MYNVGFGDCFLLTFAYPIAPPNPAEPDDGRTDRHILIDFGSTSRARSGVSLKTIAQQLAVDCDGRLDAVVVTHRHRDHLSGFASDAAAKIVAGLDPRLIVRPWTENPRLKATAGRPADVRLAGSADGSPEAALLSRLRAGEALARRIVDRAEREGRGRQTDLVQLAEDELSNAEAVAELDRLSRRGRGEYLSAGRPTRLAKVLPGVSISVLGPPRPRQWPAVSRQAEESDEYWLSAGGQIGRLFGTSSRSPAVPVGTARWIVDRMRGDEQRQLSALVRWLDDALNNTSLILLLEVGGHALLFGGDAQIENWGWALAQAGKDAALRKALGRVDLYKVGHHGSRNGTPVSLYDMWSGEPAVPAFLAMMSTKQGLHGSDGGAVPRSTLVKALKERGRLLSTDDTEADWIDVRASLPDGPYEVTHAPIRRHP